MNKFITIPVLLCIVSLIVGCSDTDNSEVYTKYEPMEMTVGEAKVLNGQTDLSLRLVQAVNELHEGQNYVFSPLSAFRNVAVLANGATAETQLSLISEMGFSDVAGISEVNDFQKKLSDHLKSVDPSSKITLAESLWSADPVSDYFKDLVTPYYDVYFGRLSNNAAANRAAVNDWVRSATGGMIDNYLKEELTKESVTLYNALYFDARWGSTPEKGKELGTFRNASGTKSKVKQFIFKDAQELTEEHLMALRTYYGNGAYAMTLILPDEGYTPYDALSSINAKKWDEWQDMYATSRLYYGKLPEEAGCEYVTGIYKDIELTVPEWDMTQHIEMRPVYEKAGLSIIFAPDADFSSILGRKVAFTSGDQTINITTTHKGTTAAAVSSIKGVTASYKPSVVIDRPFAFIISEKASGVILFVGVVNILVSL